MLNYFKTTIDPMTSNAFCSPSWHINWISDTLETVCGLFGIACLSKYLKDDEWQDIYGFTTAYRCGAIGLLLAKDIYN